MPAALRPHIACFYRFARHADDIADDPALTAEDKVARLAALDAVLCGDGPGPEQATALRRSLAQTGVPVDHPRDLLRAFTRDALNNHCTDWNDLLAYCRLSAAPVGRYLLDLHGEDRNSWPAGDALCAALQILNHLQDCKTDQLALKRVYIPADWLLAEKLTPENLEQSASTPALRRVLDRCLDGVDDLLRQAAPLPARIRHWRLRLEVAAILTIAERLSRRLRHGDPLRGPVKLPPWDYGLCMTQGVFRGLRAR